MRRWLPIVAVVLALIGLHEGLAVALLRAETVAGLISPQGVALGGLLQVVGFLGVRLALVLIVPGLVLAWATARLTAPRVPASPVREAP